MVEQSEKNVRRAAARRGRHLGGFAKRLAGQLTNA
jgi:hypothetical protein